MTERLIQLGQRLAPARSSSEGPDWIAADPRFIERAVGRAMTRHGGGWCVVDRSDAISERPTRHRIDGRDWVAWRAAGVALVAPNACPHMGAELHCGRVRGGALVCPWHGLELDAAGRGAWRVAPTYDDGVLCWARVLDEPVTERPVLPARPDAAISGVVRMEARCEPEDIVANRLDPWHGVHYHPHSFAKLQMLDQSEDVLALRVAYRVAGPLCVEVDCTFHSPTRRSIVMTITDGDGAGSVVETHATPIEAGRSTMIEATIATSERPGFGVVRRLSALVRPFVEARARRLWVEDVAYAERRFQLRSQR